MADRILVSTPEMEIAIQKYENTQIGRAHV